MTLQYGSLSWVSETSTMVPKHLEPERIYIKHANICPAAGIEPASLPVVTLLSSRQKVVLQKPFHFKVSKIVSMFILSHNN